MVAAPAVLFCAGSIGWKDQPEERISLARMATSGQGVASATREAGHPLAPVLELTRATRNYVEEDVESYACRLIKRERIGDTLQEHRLIEMRVREPRTNGGQVVQPMSVFMDFRAPRDVAGRKVLFVENQNDGEMLVRKGGSRLRYVVISVSPEGMTAQSESSVPVCELSFNKLLSGMLMILERHRDADPRGTNTSVKISNNAELYDRPCRAIHIEHPRRHDALLFHKAVVYVDQEHRVPIHIEAYDWPSAQGEKPPLLCEFTYTELELNVDFDDDHFDKSALRGKSAAR
jgi:hypothetical protein